MLCYLPSYAMLCYAMLCYAIYPLMLRYAMLCYLPPSPPCMGNLSLMPYSLQLKNRASKFELCMEMFFGVFLLFHFHLLILLFRFCTDAVDQSSHFTVPTRVISLRSLAIRHLVPVQSSLWHPLAV